MTFVVAVAVFGPLVAPHSPTAFIGVPTAARPATALFGADALGRDVLSRFLHGGLTILWVSPAATLFGVGLDRRRRPRRGVLPQLARRCADAGERRRARLPADHPRPARRLRARPQLWVIVITVGITHLPRVARVMRGAAQDVVERDFVKAAEAGRREALADRDGGAAAERDEPADGRARAAHDLLDRARGRDQLPRLRAAAARGRLGPDDQREPPRRSPSQPWSVSCSPCWPSACSTVGTNLVTDGIARAAIGIDRKASHERHRGRQVRDLRVELTGPGADVVDEISLDIRPGEVLGLVGESGSGKTTVGMALLGHVRRGGAVGGGAAVDRRPRRRPPRRRGGRGRAAPCPTVVLPEPDSPTRPEHLARADLERDLVDDVDVRAGQLDLQVAHVHDAGRRSWRS